MRCILYVTSYLFLDEWTDLHETMAIAWGTFPLPIGTMKPEIGCFSQTGSSNHGNRKSKNIVSESSWVLLWGSYRRFLIPQSWWSVESFSAGYVHIGGHRSEWYIWSLLETHKTETLGFRLAHIRVKQFCMYFSVLVLNLTCESVSV